MLAVSNLITHILRGVRGRVLFNSFEKESSVLIKSLVPWCFALDHTNDRWIPVYLIDMISLNFIST